MLVAGYVSETGLVDLYSGFIIGCLAWFYIIYEIFFGQTAKANAQSGSAASQLAFHTKKMDQIVGWAIYPLGYAIGYFSTLENPNALNIIYNLADLVNKTVFGLAICCQKIQRLYTKQVCHACIHSVVSNVLYVKYNTCE